MFHVAGNGILADGADAGARLTATFGEPRALAIDSLNNIWFADWDYRRIRALCFDVASSGSFCTGKTSGLVYRVMGTGAAADGGDNVAADTAGMGQAFGLAVSNHNVYIFCGSNRQTYSSSVCRCERWVLQWSYSKQCLPYVW
jgi:hypothetical protein